MQTKHLGVERAFITSLFLMIAMAIAGCGSGGPPVAPVSGKVTYMNQPVKSGTLMFTPLGQGGDKAPGKPGVAEIREDGTYTVGTNSTNDGAVIGKHRVIYTAKNEELKPPPGKDFAPGAETVKRSPWDGLVVKQTEVEVKSGGVTLDIELGKAGAK